MSQKEHAACKWLCAQGTHAKPYQRKAVLLLFAWWVWSPTTPSQLALVPANAPSECDRSFTRSDALAKHMRTVHETEALRPSDPVPKSMQTAGGAAGKSSKLKIIIKTPQSHAAGQDDAVDDGSNADDSSADMFTPLTEDQGFAPEELEMPLKRLFNLCSLQVKWAEEDRDQLREECRRWEEHYKREWLEKEVLLDQYVEVEQAYHQRRQAVLAGALNITMTAGAPGSVHETAAKDDEVEV